MVLGFCGALYVGDVPPFSYRVGRSHTTAKQNNVCNIMTCLHFRCQKEVTFSHSGQQYLGVFA